MNFHHKKTIARLMAIQSFYQFTHQCNQKTLEQIIHDIIYIYEAGTYIHFYEKNIGNSIKFHRSFFLELINQAVENTPQIDEALHSLVTDRNNNLLQTSILKIGTTELLFFRDTPTKVVINEFVEISHQLLIDKPMINFINSILDQLCKTETLTHQIFSNE